MRILVFGDSIAQGFFDSRGGWVQRLAADIHARTLGAMNTDESFYAEVHNLGVSGDTASGVLARIVNETKARRLYEMPDLIIIAVGINDSVLIHNKAQQDVYKFQETLEHLADKAMALTNNVLFMGLSAVDEELTNPWKFSSTGKQFRNHRINLFEDTIKQVAINQEIDFVPIHDKFLQELDNGYELLSDGLHPNDLGHELIYQMISPKIEELIR
ncbi:hypothetical protein KC867_03320 [Candidatus Saccharibacteria bacterium]|nr:hypothetical protein [Candidatus Saccharibacteria bacterium]